MAPENNSPTPNRLIPITLMVLSIIGCTKLQRLSRMYSDNALPPQSITTRMEEKACTTPSTRAMHPIPSCSFMAVRGVPAGKE
jgi:hypothetical protein